MATIIYELEISEDSERVYEVSQDYSVRYLWDPFPERIDLLDGDVCIEKGTRVIVVAKNGLKMVVEFVQVAPPNTAAIKMISGPFFLKSFAGSWVFKSKDSGATKAKFIYSIKMKKWFFPLVTEAIATWYFERVAKRRLQGLKAYCESHA